MPETQDPDPAIDTDSAPIHDAREALRRHFGFREFLDGQEAVISAVLAGQDVMIVMPTGGGKSLVLSASGDGHGRRDGGGQPARSR